MLAATKLQAEEAINNNDQQGAIAFTNLYCKLAENHNKHMLRQGEMMSRDTLIGIVHAIINVIQEEFITALDFNTRMTRVLKKLEPLMLEAKDLDPNLEAIDAEIVEEQ